MVTNSELYPARFKSLPETVISLGDSPKTFWCRLTDNYIQVGLSRQEAEMRAWAYMEKNKERIKRAVMEADRQYAELGVSAE